MKRLLSLLLLICSITAMKAQTANWYTFEETSADYKELVNDTVVTGAYVNPAGVWMFELAGDMFQIFDKTFTIDNVNRHLVFSNNGFMRFEDDSSFIVLDAAFAQSDSIDNNTQLSYTIDGNPGNRRIKIQWKNLSLTNGQSGNYLNYQIWYHQLTGIMEIHYGPSDKNSSGFNTSNGPNVGLFYSRKDFTKMFEKIWITGSPENYSLDSVRNPSFNALSGVPKEGTIFRFIPRKYLLSVANNTSDSITVYPNPTADNITILLKRQTEAITAKLYDISGRLVSSYQIPQNSEVYSIPVSKIPNGMYELVLQGDSHLSTHKIEVRH